MPIKIFPACTRNSIGSEEFVPTYEVQTGHWHKPTEPNNDMGLDKETLSPGGQNGSNDSCQNDCPNKTKCSSFSESTVPRRTIRKKHRDNSTK